MKNFKLLLATTAILSTTLAMNVKAVVPITEASSNGFKVSAKAILVNPLTVAPGDAIDFGVLSGAASGDTITVPLSGAATKTGSVTLLAGAKPGSFTVSNADGYSDIVNAELGDHYNLNIPDITLETADEDECGYVTGFHATGESGTDYDSGLTTINWQDSYDMNGTKYLGATLHITNGNVTGLCSGDTTVTLIYDVQL